MKIKMAIASILISSCAISGGVLKVNVDKNIYYEGESKSFRDPLVFNCNGRCDEIKNPKTFEDAVVALRNALPKAVMEGATRAFKKTCGSSTCEIKAVDFWVEFRRLAELEPYDDTYSIAGYLTFSNTSIADLWRLGYSCASDAILCNSFARKFSTSPDMQAEILLRSAIMQAAGVNPVLNDVVEGMGDMIETPRRTVE